MITSIIYLDLGNEATPPQSFLDVARLAGELDATLTLFGAPIGTGRQRRTPHPRRPANRRGQADLEMSETEDRFATWRSCIDASVRTESVVAPGSWSTEVAAELGSGAHDLVVVSRGRSKQAIRRIRHLVRTCERPLLVVFRRLDAGVVAEVHTDDALDLNARVVSTAAAIASGLRSRVLLVCPIAADADAGRVEETQRRLQELATECGAAERCDVSLDVGSAVHVVNDRAVELDADLVVIGGSGRLGIKSRITGNAAERLLTITSRSVLIVDPSAAASSRTAAPTRRSRG